MSAVDGLDYPIALRLRGKAVLLVGAGRIAEGRAAQLVEVGAKLRVVSPEAGEGIRRLAEEGQLTLLERGYLAGDCAGAVVVFAASNDSGVNRAVAAEARGLGIWVNVADVPELCDFYVPAMGRQGPICVAVSTSGLAPGLSGVLRDRALAVVGPEYGRLARLIGRLRRVVPGGAERTRALRALMDGGAAELLRQGEHRALGRLVRDCVSPAARPERSRRVSPCDTGSGFGFPQPERGGDSVPGVEVAEEGEAA